MVTTITNDGERIVRAEMSQGSLRVEMHECLGGADWRTRVVWFRPDEVRALVGVVEGVGAASR